MSRVELAVAHYYCVLNIAKHGVIYRIMLHAMPSCQRLKAADGGLNLLSIHNLRPLLLNIKF